MQRVELILKPKMIAEVLTIKVQTNDSHHDYPAIPLVRIPSCKNMALETQYIHYIEVWYQFVTSGKLGAL